MVGGGLVVGVAAFPGRWSAKELCLGKPERKGSEESPLTDTGNQVVKPFLRKEGVFQPTEVELEDAGHRVNVVVALVIGQRIFTSLEGIFDIVHFHLGTRHSKNPLVLKTIEINEPDAAFHNERDNLA